MFLLFCDVFMLYVCIGLYYKSVCFCNVYRSKLTLYDYSFDTLCIMLHIFVLLWHISNGWNLVGCLVLGSFGIFVFLSKLRVGLINRNATLDLFLQPLFSTSTSLGQRPVREALKTPNQHFYQANDAKIGQFV